jgi:hypothetical protein
MDAGKVIGPSVPLTTPQTQPAPAAEKKAADPKDSVQLTGSMSKPWKAAKGASKTLFAGFGLGSGAVGGFAVGGAIGTTGNVIQSLFHHSLTMAGATGAGLTGGIIGGVVFGACGMLGGYQFGEKIVDAAHWIAGKFTHGK